MVWEKIIHVPVSPESKSKPSRPTRVAVER